MPVEVQKFLIKPEKPITRTHGMTKRYPEYNFTKRWVPNNETYIYY